MMGNKISLEKEHIVFFLSPEYMQNILIYSKLSGDKGIYVTYGNFNKIKINKKWYTNILAFDKKYNLYICFKRKISKETFKYICLYIAIIISDIIIINKIKNIDEGIFELDIALDLGKDIYAIPGDIFEYENYLANFAIKQGAIPICSKYDMRHILEEKKINVL